MKSVKLEWCLGEMKRANELLEESVKNYPECAKLWMMKGQIAEQEGRTDDARDAYNQGVR